MQHLAKTEKGGATVTKFTWNIELGRKGEVAAAQWLTSLGWRIQEANWRCGRFGEIDLIARDEREMLVFCEVKTRLVRRLEEGMRNEGFESVHWKKRRKIISCAMTYIAWNCPSIYAYRFDVIAIEFKCPPELGSFGYSNSRKMFHSLSQISPTIRHVRSAFY